MRQRSGSVGFGFLARSRSFARPSTNRPGLLPRFVETKSSWRSYGANRDSPPQKGIPDELESYSSDKHGAG